MRDICVLLLMAVAIINLFGVMFVYPASEQKMEYISLFNAGVAIITIFTLVFKGRK